MSLIPRECKRLAEVDFPIAKVSLQAAREKSIRHGHPSTLHLWWARRPLASTRGMLMALLLPDPCDPACPIAFKDRARAILPRTLVEQGATDADLRQGLLGFIADFSDWDKSGDGRYLSIARSLVRAANGDRPPVVIDPFAGGGSIPLEAMRVGCEAFSSDLNPVPCLIQRALLEVAAERGTALAPQLRETGLALQDELRKAMADYSRGGEEVAFIWTRTARCESPGCGAEIPLLRSKWLSTRHGNWYALRLTVSREQSPPAIQIEVFRPSLATEVGTGVVSQAKARCAACSTILSPDRLRAQLAESRGGGDPIFEGRTRIGGARLVAVVTNAHQGGEAKRYRDPTEADYECVRRAQQAATELATERDASGLPRIPHEHIETPQRRPFQTGDAYYRFVTTLNYGMTHWSDLHTMRQRLGLAILAKRISEVQDQDLRILLAMALGRCADYWTSLAVWAGSGEFVAHTFGRHALPMVWDFAEAAPWAGGSGSFESAVEWVARVAEAIPPGMGPGHTMQADAAEYPLDDASCDVWFTDPPYYDAIGYSILADFFFVWHKRALPGMELLKDRYDPKNELTPKDREIIETVSFLRAVPKDHAKDLGLAVKDAADFESGIRFALAHGRRVLKEDGIAALVFAHRSTEGWEAMLQGIVNGGWMIEASWPLATERPGRLHSRDAATLATSIHLVMRPRPSDAPVGDWSEVSRELPERVRTWMDRLDREGVRGADLVFACIGPAMEIYSRYSKVVDAQDREIPLGGDPLASEPQEQGFLAKVWQVVGRLALEHVLSTIPGGPTSLEEDARLTALFLWALQSSSEDGAVVGGAGAAAVRESVDDNEEERPSANAAGYTLPYDVVRRFAQPLGIHLEAWEDRIITTEKGIVRLIPIEDRAVQLFGQENIAAASSHWTEPDSHRWRQEALFPGEVARPTENQATRGRKRLKKTSTTSGGATDSESRRRTTLDRLHTAMLLQGNGAAAALRSFLEEEHRRGPELQRLATAFAALYPRGSEDRRLVEALTLAFPR
jgi:putative DNA methylase